MNRWEIVWNAYYDHSTNSRYVAEIWHRSNRVYRMLLCASVVGAIHSTAVFTRSNELLSLALWVASQLGLLLTMKITKESGLPEPPRLSETALAPANNRAHQRSRYLRFDQRLRSAPISRLEVEHLFEVADAHFHMATQRDSTLKWFGILALTVTAGLVVSAIERGSATYLSFAASLLLGVSGFMLIVAQLWPSRKEKLSELRYFMTLYAKGCD